MTDPRRVGVNLLWLVPGVVGGSEEYTMRLLGAIADADRDGIDLTLYARPELVDAHPDVVAAFPTVVAPLRGDDIVNRVAVESTWLRSRARDDRLDLLHHAGGTIPYWRATPAMVTIHDLQPLASPRSFSWLKRLYLRERLPAAVRASRRVVAVSEFVRDDIVTRLGASPERIAVVSSAFSARDLQPPASDPRSTYRLDDPYFVYPAITYEHKNHAVLLRAFAGVRASHPACTLVLTGGAGGADAEVAALIGELGLTDHVRRPGRVPRADLDWLLQHAVALTFPSRYEGFGLPVLEAMGNGCPVVAADTTALPEVVDGAGVLVGPDDVSGWTAAMQSLLDDGNRRAELVAAGRRRAAMRTMDDAVAAALGAYRDALEATAP